MTSTTTPAALPPVATSTPPAPPRLARSDRDKKIAGVCAGLAEHTGVDAVLWRVAFIALTLAGGGSGILVYGLLWLLMPAPEARV
ncbi:putative stress-responsive transcriptional regulator (fragment) [Modestobacter italicus]|uniref:Stress-responsive transcriptional regulator n=1 Tax=Modestobacter italicus (strain DSM 44449 / CECT 9708 / BC 501) TaxID=2732864 RepID=I4F3L6_MODI5